MRIRKSRRGHALLITIGMLSLAGIHLGSMLTRVESETHQARHRIAELRTELLAEDALLAALHRREGLPTGVWIPTDTEGRRATVVVESAPNDQRLLTIDATIETRTMSKRRRIVATADANAPHVIRAYRLDALPIAAP